MAERLHFFLEVLVITLHPSPVAYWTPSNLGVSSSSVLSFCLFTLSMGFSRQEYWNGLPFPLPVGHILSKLIMTCPSWVALHSMAHSFTELRNHHKAVIQEGRVAAGVIKNLCMVSLLLASSVCQVTLHMQLLVFLLQTNTSYAPILTSPVATQQKHGLM